MPSSVIRDRLLPLAALVTPNLDEASLLTGLPVRDATQMEQRGRGLRDSGAAAVLLKGGSPRRATRSWTCS